ncbi:P-loop NTPase fold protein [Engelhardtia mirabilis]
MTESPRSESPSPKEAAELLEIARQAKANGRWIDAVTSLRQAVEIDESSAPAWRELGIALNKLDGRKDPRAGERELRRAIKIDAQDFDALASLGGLLYRAGEEEQAFDCYLTAAIGSKGDPYPVLMAVKLQARASGKLELEVLSDLLDEAEEHRSEQAFADPPEDTPWCFFDLAEIALYRGRPDEALQMARKGLTLSTADWMPATFARALRTLPPGLGIEGLNEVLNLAERRAVDLGAEVSDSGAITPSAADERAPELVQVLASRLPAWFRANATPEEACLHAREYAQALARFFAGAQDELCFGLLGHWGRGKTFLMDLVCKRLERENWATVQFSAWKYPSTPGLWVNLYETVRGRAVDGSTARSLGLALRTALIKNGTAPLVWSLLLVLLVLVPLQDGGSAALDVLAGAGGLLAGLNLLAAMTSRAGLLRKRFLAVARHEAHLGLQAVLGNDLEALIRAWTPTARDGPDDQNETTAAFAAWRGALLVSVATVVGAVVTCAVTTRVLGADPWTGRIAVLALGTGACVAWLIAYWFWIAAAHGGPHPDRVILVVDDLDRCEPKAMLEIAESLKLFLEQPRLKGRLFVVMLVDEVAFGRAILAKYETLRASNEQAKSTAFEGLDDLDVLQENLEKIFVAYLRLGPISPDELDEVAAGILGPEEVEEPVARPTESAESTPSEGGSDQDADDVDDFEAATGNVDEESRATPPAMLELRGSDGSGYPPLQEHVVEPPEPAAPLEPSAVFTAEERRAIRSAARGLGHEEGPSRSGPRSVRCFVARYQLAREILRSLGKDRSPDLLAKAVLGRRALEGVDDSILIAIAEQVGAVYERPVSSVAK